MLDSTTETPEVDYTVFQETEAFIHNLVVLPNSHFKKFKVGITSKGVMTHVYCLTELDHRNLRGMRWNSVTLVSITEGLLKNEYPDAYRAIYNACIAMQTKMLEV